MNLFGYDFSIKRAPSSPPIGRSSLPNGRDAMNRYSYQMVNNELMMYDNKVGELVQKGYRMNPDLFAVVNYILNKATRAKFFLYEKRDEKAYEDYCMLKGEGATVESLRQAGLIRRKALVETTHDNIDRLLVQPNPEQDFRTFAEMAIGYRLLSGESFLHLVGGIAPVSRIYSLPPATIDIHPGPTYLSIDHYHHRPSDSEIAAHEMVYSRNFSPVWNDETDELRGLSPLRVLALTLQKSNEGRMAGAKQFQNSGPPGILSFEDRDLESGSLSTEQAKQIEEDIYRKQANNKQGNATRARIYVTNMKADWTSLGLSPIDLDLLKSGLFDLRDFCRVYQVDSKVMGDPDSSTYNNMAEARRAAVVDAVVPVLTILQNDLNQAIAPYNVNGKKYVLDADVSHFPELAEDLNTMVQRLERLPITPNQFLDAMQYEPFNHPLMNEPWFPMGRQPISDFAAQLEATTAPNIEADKDYL